jgi:hypothetical protein
VREGDAGTRFFHAHATIRHRQNTISSLQDSNGSIQQTHEEKAALLWNSFKERLGISEISQMLFNLRDMLLPVDGLESLEAPFTKEEIDDIVAKLPNNKSDGFTNKFIKGCWPLLAEDFYWLCNAFNESNVCLRSINSSHITLIPKKDGPQIVLDYRPISLLNKSAARGYKRIDPQESVWFHKNKNYTRLLGLGFRVHSHLSQVKEGLYHSKARL